MSKIIFFSFFQEPDFISKKIDKIKKELEKDSCSKKKLQSIQQEIFQLSDSLNKELEKQAERTSQTVHQFLFQQTALSSLIYTCQSLYIDKQVDEITLNAQKLASDGTTSCKNLNLSKKISKINRCIKSLHHMEALSLENRQMIGLAKQYLKAAKTHSSITGLNQNTKAIRFNFQQENSKKDLLDVHGTNILLYEIAGSLYDYHLKEALGSFYSLPLETQKKVKELCTTESIDFDIIKNPENTKQWRNSIYNVIQVLLGYSHEILNGFFEKPSFKEIDALFRDLHLILNEDQSANF